MSDDAHLHQHREGGQRLEHTHGSEDLAIGTTLDAHGYFQHKEDPPVRTIQITDPQTKAFYAGVATGSDLSDQIAQDGDLSKATFEERLAWYWLYVGSAAASKEEVTQDTMLRFVAGAQLRAPTRSEEFVLTFSTKGLYDPDREPGPDEPDVLGVEIAHILRNVRDDICDLDGRDQGRVVGGPDSIDQVGTWQVFS